MSAIPAYKNVALLCDRCRLVYVTAWAVFQTAKNKKCKCGGLLDWAGGRWAIIDLADVTGTGSIEWADENL